MILTVNGKEELVREGATLADLLNLRKLDPDSVIVEYNNDIVNQEKWSGIVLKKDDRIEILRFVGGG
jgi:sulfur carrier protein